jgi:hypothetical protein
MYIGPEHITDLKRLFTTDHGQQHPQCTERKVFASVLPRASSPFFMLDVGFDVTDSNLQAAKFTVQDTLRFGGVAYDLFGAAYQFKKQGAGHYVAEAKGREGRLVRYDSLAGMGNETKLQPINTDWIFRQGRPEPQCWNLVCIIYVRRD